MVSTPVILVITWVTAYLPIPQGWKAALALVTGSRHTVYSLRAHMLPINRAQGSESPLAKDRHPNH